ncbi:bifunctional folylpolyglutamate synthase/dihydrofolate synthase [Salibacter halophilus]|uniref:Dihydrofolate synthase/folylpolyglutamate synthase n=1 Tax=Salibacter halophilus TaxID=1803916 RepID=A0A6N6MAM3_9FLAO|nr:folylpolyglutamate synthase/dihydrofolate synthase family protein [Salibacter halophilus]KAB1066302.1 bifunctional folylpolyglutamate synthase/dihydrofolate synthase [Salibacter halophilus]
MTYEQTLDFLFSQLPMYQRQGKSAYKADLSNTIALMEALDQPQKNFPSIHIAGTNGKGSTAHMMASVLQEAGYKVGLYTSPHLMDFRERVKINGVPVSKDFVIDFVGQNRDQLDKIQPSFFEWTVGLAFEYFRQEKVDIAVIETGMGGRLDSTNILTPLVSVITNIGFDHSQFLGDTIEKIAGEKAGIIKSGIPIVTGKMHPDAFTVIEKIANEKNAELFPAKPTQLQTDLLGNYQKENIETATTALSVLTDKTNYKLENKHFTAGLKNVVKNTGLMGRWQILQEKPLIVTDVAHNEDGLRSTMTQLRKQDADQLHIVFGSVSDKDLKKIIPLLPVDAFYYLCSPDIPRAMDADELEKLFKANNLNTEKFSSVEAAFQGAKKKMNPSDVLYIGGSTFVVAEILPLF